MKFSQFLSEYAEKKAPWSLESFLIFIESLHQPSPSSIHTSRKPRPKFDFNPFLLKILFQKYAPSPVLTAQEFIVLFKKIFSDKPSEQILVLFELFRNQTTNVLDFPALRQLIVIAHLSTDTLVNEPHLRVELEKCSNLAELYTTGLMTVLFAMPTGRKRTTLGTIAKSVQELLKETFMYKKPMNFTEFLQFCRHNAFLFFHCESIANVVSPEADAPIWNFPQYFSYVDSNPPASSSVVEDEIEKDLTPSISDSISISDKTPLAESNRKVMFMLLDSMKTFAPDLDEYNGENEPGSVKLAIETSESISHHLMLIQSGVLPNGNYETDETSDTTGASDASGTINSPVTPNSVNSSKEPTTDQTSTPDESHLYNDENSEIGEFSFTNAEILWKFTPEDTNVNSSNLSKSQQILADMEEHLDIQSIINKST